MPNRGAHHGRDRRTNPTAYRHSTHRASDGPGAADPFPTSLTFSAESQPRSPAIPHAGIRTGELIGHRLWWVVKVNNSPTGYRLRSLAHDRIWRPGETVEGNTNAIVAMNGSLRPIWGGVYSYPTPAHLTKEIRFWADLVYAYSAALVCGTIKMWGDVVEHEAGYRAQYAKVLSLDAIVWGDPVGLEALRQFYLPVG